MLEEELKNKIATKYFKKFDCDGIIKRIDFSVRMRRDVAHNVSTPHTDHLLWAEAKQQPTDIYRMLAQLLITIKADAADLTPPKFLGCFDNEKIAFVPYYDVLPVFNLNDFNWTQTPSQVDQKTVDSVKATVDSSKIFAFFTSVRPKTRFGNTSFRGLICLCHKTLGNEKARILRRRFG